MKLSDTDRENIEVLESLDVDENTLLKLLLRYFAYRHKRINEQYGYTPNQALQATVQWGMLNYGDVNVDTEGGK